MPTYYLILTRKRAAHVGSDTKIVELEGETLEEARGDADRQLRGEPANWHAEARPCAGIGLNIHFFLNAGQRGALLSPAFFPYETAQIVQVVDDRPSLRFHEELTVWADAEKQKLSAQFDADPEYQEFLRLTKKFLEHPS